MLPFAKAARCHLQSLCLRTAANWVIKGKNHNALKKVSVRFCGGLWTGHNCTNATQYGTFKTAPISY